MINAGKKGCSTFVSELGWSEANNPQNTCLPGSLPFHGKKRKLDFSEELARTDGMRRPVSDTVRAKQSKNFREPKLTIGLDLGESLELVLRVG